MMWNGFEPMGWTWMGFGLVYMVLFWILLIIGIVAIAKWLRGGGSRPSAIDILKARYANGELTRDEYERMRRELAA